MSLDNLRTGFLEHLEKKGRSQSTLIAYSKDIQQLSEFVANGKPEFDIKNLNVQTLQKYVDNLKQNGDYTLKTVSRKINSLKTFCKYLLDQRLIVSDVSLSIAHPEFKPQPPRTLSPLEYRALRDTARSNLRLYTMVELLLQTGLRIGELSRLKVADVDLKAGIMNISEFTIVHGPFQNKDGRLPVYNPKRACGTYPEHTYCCSPYF